MSEHIMNLGAHQIVRFAQEQKFTKTLVEFKVGPEQAFILRPGDLVCTEFPGAPKESYRVCSISSNGDIKAFKDDAVNLQYPDCNECKICDSWAIDILKVLCDDDAHIGRCCVTLAWRNKFPTDLSEIVKLVGGC